MSHDFASIQEMINVYPINKIYNQKYNFLFHIFMLKFNQGHMNVIHVQMMIQQDLIKVFPLLWISIYKKTWFLHKHILKNKKSIIHLKLFTFKFFWKIPCIEKKIILEKKLRWKICLN
jgi:hypothetical protein